MNFLFVAGVVGWIGAVLLLVAYALLSFKKLSGDSLVFQAMNVAAGTFLAVSSYSRDNYPLVFVNSFWSVIGVVAIANLLRKNGRSYD